MASRSDTGAPPNCEEMVQEKPLTILLLGEIGVGKSTFINAFINYLAYNGLEDAKENVKCLIPTEFTLCDEDFKTRVVSFGQPDPNEVHKPGQSSTVNCRSYVVKHNGKTVLFIDTPGIDSQGGQRRGKSLGVLLDVITYFKEIHAICIFMKPNNAQLDAVFKDCILKLLSHWDKSVTNNILFVFTNTRGTSYRPGQTLEPLRKILDEVKCKPPNIDIRLGKDNIFCLDNEPFRFLVAVSPPNNNQFAPVEIENCKSSWHTSKKECLRLLETASSVLPYIVQDSGSDRPNFPPTYEDVASKKITTIVAVSPPNNNQFAPVEIENCKSSWHTSKKECLRLLETASSVLPYIVQDSGSDRPNFPPTYEDVVASKKVTILLLGETGVGKSTFVNAFANYLSYDELEEAKGNAICLIPTRFTLRDENFKKRVVAFGTPDSNENHQAGKSSTLNCRCYVFNVGNTIVRLIDAPGIGDTRGVQTDGTNMRNLLDFLANYKEIHAICILLKPNNARVDVVFKYCILQLLTHLDKSAARNIMFIFTNARSTFYKPGDTAESLEVILDAIKKKPPHVHIKFEQDNVYCLDNESFRFLVASTPPNDIMFRPDETKDFQISWRRSVEECRRLLINIIKIPPHCVEDTISVNKARTSILLLTEPLGQIAQYIGDNVKACKVHKKTIFEWEGDIGELSKNLYTPSVDIISEPLDHPRTVCGDPNCCEKLDVDGSIKTHYKTVCHDPCHLDSSDGNVIGDTGLLDCQAFNKYELTEKPRWKKLSGITLVPDSGIKPNENGEVCTAPARRTKLDHCVKCTHSFQVHLHIFTNTKIEHKKVRDELKYGRIEDRKQAVKAQNEIIKELEARITKFEKERDLVTKYTAKFASFLSHNALTPFNDAFEDYLQHCITNAKSDIQTGEQDMVSNLEKMLMNHKKEKEILQSHIKKNHTEQVSSKDVQDAIEELCKLEICGTKIKEYMDAQQVSRRAAHVQHREVQMEKPKSNSWRNWLPAGFRSLKKW